uniref:NADH dehydrogenase subunit 2 n=1 Tax=Dinothenarus chrysocomus TaxID=2977781 RepID=UPI0021CC94E4|nr:NADH dehydrogenase subunit 2 [Dinothenarus chrysocomus]UWM92612.1 NADH dehydrogenase subunit 2 [Dinothenarus chrysocomus]
MKFYKLLFLPSLMIGSIITISSLSWMSMWMGLEINLLSIIPLMNSNKNLFSAEASLKYFITQALASTILLFSIILLSNNIFLINQIMSNIVLIFNSALLTKMGAAPFHFWFPEIMEGLSWMNCIIILTWQKIAPMVILMYNINFSSFFFFIIIFSMLVSGIIGFNQISIRKIIAYSSINHMGWMISSMFVLETIWMYYFLIYTLISLNIILIFWSLNIFYLKQLFISMNNNLTLKFFFMLNFLSLGGLPPFIGFFPKWLTVENLITNNFFILTFSMVILTLLTLFYYIRLMFSTLVMNMTEINYLIFNKFNQFWMLTSNFVSIISFLTCTVFFNFS